MSRNKWTRPQLIVLTRGTPEESVLLHCKRIGNTGWSSDATSTAQVGCDKAEPGNCGNCQSRSGS